MKAAAGEGYATATDLADWLVRTLKMPFPDAHTHWPIVGLASKQGWRLHELPLKTMQGRARSRSKRYACCRSSLRQEPHQLWRHHAEERDGTAKAWLKRLEKEQKLG